MPQVILQRLVTSTDPARRALYAREAHGSTDLGTWFNAAPTGWWARRGLATVALRVTGRGAVTLHATREGRRTVVARADLEPGVPWTVPVGTAGTDWCWLTVEPGASGDADAGTSGTVRLDDVTWTADVPAGVRPLTVVVPTFGMEDAALAQVAHLTAPGLSGVVGRVVLVDQGRTLAAHPGAAAVLAAAGERVLLVEQDNLGGSGGYARGMLEAAARWPDDPVVLHDDDARAEPETLRRLQALNAVVPDAVLATGLLALEQPTTLQALAEGVARRTFRWGPVDGVGDGVDVGAGTPDGWTFAQPNDTPDYGGWWGCLLPAGAVARLGPAAPYFIKWDDAELGLRARRAGVDVVSVPGLSVWHQTWAEKGTLTSWSSWPLHRNRFATALAYGAGRGVVLDSLVHQLKHVLSLQYDVADLWDAGLAEVLQGPGWLDADLVQVRPRAQALLDARPPAREPGRGRTTRLGTAAELGWRDGIGRAAVVFEDGSRPLVRDRARAARTAVRTAGLHVRLLLRWSGLRRAYAAALPRAASPAAWERRFAGTHGSSV